jgi:hypothetical protein
MKKVFFALVSLLSLNVHHTHALIGTALDTATNVAQGATDVAATTTHAVLEGTLGTVSHALTPYQPGIAGGPIAREAWREEQERRLAARRHRIAAGRAARERGRTTHPRVQL